MAVVSHIRFAAMMGMIAAALLVSACNSTEATLDPDAVATQTQGVEATQTNPAPVVASGQQAALGGGVRVYVAPIVGSTVEALTPLSRRISLRARESGIVLNASGEPNTQYTVKGYFSALPEDQETTIIYVWDVLDTAGNRVHRIQGQQVSAGADVSAPWTNVPPATMETIADTTVNELASWFARQSG